jgi:hypothetical protein
MTSCVSRIGWLRGSAGALLLLVTGASACIEGQAGRSKRGESFEPVGSRPVLVPAITAIDPCELQGGGGQVVADAGAAEVDVGAGAGAGGGGQAGGGDQAAVAFPPLIDVKLFQLDVAAAGGPGNSGAIFTLVNAVAKNAADDLQRFVDVAKVTIDVDAQGRQVERRTAVGFESRQTFEKGIQYGVVFLNGSKKLQFIRNHNTGAFEGIIVAPSFDNNAPISSIVTPNSDGTFTHLIVEDIGNNLKNDYRGELIVDARLAPLRFSFFQQFNGGLAAQPESAALVKKFDFAGIAGF